MQRRKYAILAVCCMGLLLVSIDNTIVNVALPSIATQLGASVQTLQWTVDAYLLVLASLLILSGSLADRFGRKRVFMTGLAIFVFGSAMCGLTISETWLVAFRVVQAIGGSMMTPVALAIVTNVFTGPGERAKAIGYWAAASGLGIALGPLLGGFLVDAFGWRSIFWVNVPVGLAAIILTARLVPESRARAPRRFDPIGQGLVFLVIVCLTFGIIEVPALGWGSPVIFTVFELAAAAIVILVPYELHRRQPLVEIRLFTNRAFSAAWSTTLVGFVAFAGLLFANTFYLQDSRGLSASAAGLLSLPLAASVIIAATVSGRLVARGKTRATLVSSGIALTAAPVMLAFFGPTTPLGWIVIPFIIFGAGYGLLNDPVNNTAVSELPNDQAGVAASLVATSRQLGSVLGVAIIGTLLSTGRPAALTTVPSGFGVAVSAVLAACGLAVVLINLLPARRSALVHQTPPTASIAALRP
ncbi:MFS transporter [Diaminobutyricibacter tongyongensis]|uniref:MFS transporter n=2 Tax=Leifsonia tongyongensis TaxID=1268043 RepID=A0A6L9XWT1_9MICO|nr:MFS transporter [Diaminobutyricibacter tongyongensis]NEN05891.1 MFS transporter [Diaminobutyricibacter tongyongensis]